MTMNQEGYPVFKGLQKPLEFMGIRGRFLTLAAAGIGGSFVGFFRHCRRLHRFLNRFGKGCRIHSHDGHGTGGTDNHLHQAAWRTPQQEKGKRYLYLQKPEKRTVNHFIQYGTQKEKNI